MSNSTLAGSVDAQPSSNSDANLDDLCDVLKAVKEAAASGLLPHDMGWEGDQKNYSPPTVTDAQLPNEDEDIPMPSASPSESSDEDDDGVSPLEYARLYGLSRNHLSDPVAFDHIRALQAVYLEDIGDDSLPQFDFGPEPRLDERLSLSKDAASLLQAVAKQDTQETIDKLMFPMLSSSDIKNTKVELPLLTSDHETDCRHFARWDRFEIKLKDVRFPLEVVDEEKNEGIGFPSAYWQLGDGIMENLKKEKLEVTRDTMVYLQTALKNTWSHQNDEELWQAEMTYKRSTALQPVTPPLFPMSPPSSHPYEPSPSDPAFQLEVLSDPPSLIEEDLEAIEKVIFEQDLPTPIRNQCPSSSETLTGTTTLKLSDVYPPMASLDNDTSPSLEIQRFKRDDFKVEGPLTPLNPTLSKSVRFSEVIEEMDLDPLSPAISPPNETFFQDSFGKAAEKAKQQLEQETLVDADTTARVEVRKMESVVTQPPWQKFQQCKSSAELLEMQMQVLRSLPTQDRQSWAGVNYPRLQEKIRYNPFPHDLAKVALEESIALDDDTWKAFVKCSNEKIIDSSDMAWKPPGLRILQFDEEDDDDIEAGVFSQAHPRDMSYLVKKRKLELDQGDLGTEGPMQIDNLQSKQPLRGNAPKPSHFLRAVQQLQTVGLEEPGILLGGRFSAETMLGNFMELRGLKKRKLTDSPDIDYNKYGVGSELVRRMGWSDGEGLGAGNNKGRASPIQPQQRPRNAGLGWSHPSKQAPVAKQQAHIPQDPTPAEPAQVTNFQLPIRVSPVAKQAPLPVPAVVSTGPQSVIISMTLLRNRALIKSIETLLPDLTLIERNFAAHNTTAWMPGSVTRSPITSPLDSEADLIVSPSTGVVITTLQKIKQKPLPGSKSKPEIRARLEKVSTRYEKLAVFVSEGRKDETTNGMDEHDCLALSEFLGFSAGLVATTTVQFIGGGDQTLAKWLASSVTQHHVADSTGLLEEETHWEVFLRRAGMNAFAAQAVIAKLKAPEGVDATSPTKAAHFGLTSFVNMGRDQRLAMFGSVCGRGVIERVSAVVDARWS